MPSRPLLRSPRLRYRELADDDLGDFHALVLDEHIRRYLMDGEVVDRGWCRDAIAVSTALFTDRGVGLWLISEPTAEAAIGFCGFHVFPDIEPEPQLLYALLESVTGRGYATEAAKACMEYARSHAGFGEIRAGVDEPNQASMRVLEKLGFAPCGDLPGVFGRTLLFRHS
ncbi:GNAT family N-acetyltransferase [Haliangium sp.]|uniref:GNAT family N-acetyltransferase n=1 Tax=Haliangium sp. TaxID=2663208 RepID=UPI003D13C4E6